MNLRKNGIVVLLCLLMVPFVSGQVGRQTGVLKGTVAETNGTPLPGATVTAQSPSMMGVLTIQTDVEGAYRFVNLPPGTYEITATLTGFKTVKHPGIDVTIGQTLSVNMVTEPTTLAEEVTVSGVAPVVDIESNRMGNVLTNVLLLNLPLGRKMEGLLNTVAGANNTITTYAGSIHGGFWNTTTYEIDGVNNNDPTHGGMLVKPQYDSMDEVEVSTGGLPAQVGNTGGSFVNVVTKSGGNEFHGQAQIYYTNEHLAESLFPKEDLTAMGFGKPTLPKFDVDMSASIGGPILKDKVWFFGTLGLLNREYYTNFQIPGPTVNLVNGGKYTQYKDPYKEMPFFLKVTTQISKSLRFFAMANGSVLNRDVYNGGGSRVAYDATFTLKNNSWLNATGELNWIVGPNTFVDFRGGFTNRWYPITSRDASRNNRGYIDYYNGYNYNGINTWESYITRRNTQASVRLTHFVDDLLGGNHEFGAGIEYQLNMDRYGFARGNPITQYFYDGDVYTTNGRRYTGTTDPIYGDGAINIAAMGTNAGGADTTKDLSDYKISAYVQDSFTIKQRLTINVGFRFDHYNGYYGGGTSTGVADDLALAIGEQLKPGAGYNPFAAFSMAEMKDLVKSTTLAPRIGLSYDLFGDGKTAIKASYSRYYEALPVMWFSAAQPGIGAAYTLNWFDLNGNGILDATDKYTPRGGWSQFAPPDFAVLRARLKDDYKTPGYDEYTVSISHELTKNLVIRAQYLHKYGFDQYNSQLYDYGTGKYWYSLDVAPSGYWVPFTCTVPGVGEFAPATVTVYGASYKAPVNNWDTKTGNNPDSKRNYNAFEFTFDKRYTDGWAMGGSVVYSVSKSDNPYSPNDYMFYGQNRDNDDVPFAIKLYGSVDLPLGFMGSFFYTHASGYPYARSVYIVFPDEFVAANNMYDTGTWCYIEPIGTHRTPSWDNVDVRLEKSFTMSFGKLSIFADILNLLGYKTVELGRDPGGTYFAATNELVDISYDYGRPYGVTGQRTFKFSARFTF